MNTTFNLETGNGTSPLWVHYNNPGGVKVGGRYHKYDSKEQGLEALKRLLREDYVAVYGYDIKAIRERYCQCGPEDYPKFMSMYRKELEKYGKVDY